MALKDRFAIHQAAVYAEISGQIQVVPIDLFLVHRSMVDDGQLRQICSLRQEGKVFVLSDRPNDAEGLACLKAGSVGYGNAYISSARLMAAVEALFSGLAWVGKSLMQHMVQKVVEAAANDGRSTAGAVVIKDLSPREKEITYLLAGGLPNQVIAEKLGITERTVKAHLGAIYAKTGLQGRLALALSINRGA